jgi:hypothetical protein
MALDSVKSNNPLNFVRTDSGAVLPFKKCCNKCREEKPAEDFFRDRTRKDGRFHTCKICITILKKDYYTPVRKRMSRTETCLLKLNYWFEELEKSQISDTGHKAEGS